MGISSHNVRGSLEINDTVPIQSAIKWLPREAVRRLPGIFLSSTGGRAKRIGSGTQEVLIQLHARQLTKHLKYP